MVAQTLLHRGLLWAAFFVSAAIGYFALAAAPAHGQDCYTLADIEGKVTADGSAIAHDFRGGAAAAWLGAYNATPPTTNITGDQVVVIEHPRRPTLYVYVLTEGCATSSGEMDRMFIFQLNAAVGTPS